MYFTDLQHAKIYSGKNVSLGYILNNLMKLILKRKNVHVTLGAVSNPAP